MELTNKRESYTVENSAETLKLFGDVTVSNEKIASFSGSFQTIDNMMAGNFSFSETGSNNNINISGVPTNMLEIAYNLVTITVSEIHKNFSSVTA